MSIEVFKSSKQLAQVRPNSNSAVSAIVKTEKKKYVLTNIVVTNTTNSNVAYSLYHDKDGTTYDQTTALAYSKTLVANDYTIIEWVNGYPLDIGYSGNFAVQTSSANALTFTINGAEF